MKSCIKYYWFLFFPGHGVFSYSNIRIFDYSPSRHPGSQDAKNRLCSVIFAVLYFFRMAASI